MAYRRKATSLSDFEPTEETFDNDLLKVTFENGQAVFVYLRGISQDTRRPVWAIHEDFCPSGLKELREPGMDYREDIKGRPFDVPVNITATVGEQAEFYVYPIQHIKTVSAIVSIEPCAYQDAYHDDLDIIFLQTIRPH